MSGQARHGGIGTWVRAPAQPGTRGPTACGRAWLRQVPSAPREHRCGAHGSRRGSGRVVPRSGSGLSRASRALVAAASDSAGPSRPQKCPRDRLPWTSSLRSRQPPGPRPGPRGPRARLPRALPAGASRRPAADGGLWQQRDRAGSPAGRELGCPGWERARALMCGPHPGSTCTRAPFLPFGSPRVRAPLHPSRGPVLRPCGLGASPRTC